MASFATTSGSRNARFTAGHDRSRGTPEEFKRLIVDEIRNWKDTAQRADIKAEWLRLRRSSRCLNYKFMSGPIACAGARSRAPRVIHHEGVRPGISRRHLESLRTTAMRSLAAG
jgi:hypothetical protein